MKSIRSAAVLAATLAAPLALAACAMPPIQGGGVVSTPAGQPGGQATMVIEQHGAWPTPLATVSLADGEVFRGKVIHERTQPDVGVGFGSTYGWGPRRGGLGYGTGMVFTGPEETTRASALLIGDRGHSMTCDIRTADPGAFYSGGFAECKVSDGRIVALQF